MFEGLLTLSNLLIAGVALLIGLLTGVAMMVLMAGGGKGQVLYVSEQDHSGEKRKIVKADSVKIITNGNPPLRIYKFRDAYQFVAGMGRKTTTFFVKQGSAYNMALESGPKDIKANLAEIVKLVWGDLFYLTVPEDRIAQLRNNNLLMTVKLEAGLTPVGYTPIKEENINSDGDESMAAAVAKGVTKGMGVPILNYIMAMGAGGCVIFIACLAMGWINIGK